MKLRHREMKELAYSLLEATLRRKSRKYFGSSSALCIISFSFPKRQHSVTGTLPLMNMLQAIAHSNLTTVFGLIFFNDQHCLLHFRHYSFPVLVTVFPVWKDTDFEREKKNRSNSADFRYKLVLVYFNEGRMLARYIELSSIQGVLWDLKYSSGQDMERADGTSV